MLNVGLFDNITVLFIYSFCCGYLLIVKGSCVNNGRGIEMGGKGRR